MGHPMNTLRSGRGWAHEGARTTGRTIAQGPAWALPPEHQPGIPKTRAHVTTCSDGRPLWPYPYSIPRERGHLWSPLPGAPSCSPLCPGHGEKTGEPPHLSGPLFPLLQKQLAEAVSRRL